MHHASHQSVAHAMAVIRTISASSPAEDRPSIPFVVDACENLRVLRGMHGRRGAPYLRQLRRYRTIADSLGCRRALERHLHPLRRRPMEGQMQPWRPRAGAGALPTAAGSCSTAKARQRYAGSQ